MTINITHTVTCMPQRIHTDLFYKHNVALRVTLYTRCKNDRNTKPVLIEKARKNFHRRHPVANINQLIIRLIRNYEKI